jgi:excisionase family DNA binding protein
MTSTSPATGITPKLYKTDEAAAMLRLSPSMIYRQMRAGRLRSVHQGRARLIPAAAIDEYIALLEREAGQEDRAGAGPELRTPDAETVVAALWPPVAVMLARDVEARPGGRYRGRVRWKDPATGRYRGHSRTFGSETAAWAWVSTWTAPPIATAERDTSLRAAADASRSSAINATRLACSAASTRDGSGTA